MRELHEHPPNYDWICAAFPSASQPGVLFAYTPYIYNPSGIEIHPSLVDHERVHIQRQAIKGPEDWWQRYMLYPKFRLEEERLAHIAEALNLVKSSGNNRAARRRIAVQVGHRLANPLYNLELTTEAATKLIWRGLRS